MAAIKAKKKVRTGITASGKRKTAKARAYVRPGTGRIYVNGASLSSLQSPLSVQVIAEPMSLVEDKNFDASITVRGGGTAGQAQASRTALAKAIVAFKKDPELEKKMLAFDRSMLVNDSRQVEPKKFKGPKARARFTKSYR